MALLLISAYGVLVALGFVGKGIKIEHFYNKQVPGIDMVSGTFCVNARHEKILPYIPRYCSITI